jgi:acyl transferase domain-containing protein
MYADSGRPALTIARSASYSAAISRALHEAGASPEDVRFVEAQANGLKIAQGIEAGATAAVYRPKAGSADVSNPLYLGSCKVNFGYLEHASGAPSLLKTALALAHGEIPPQPGAAELDPDIAWQRLGLCCPAQPVPWPGGGRRVAGVTSVGLSGTVMHAVLENVPDDPAEDASRSDAAMPLLVLSAHTTRALARTAARLREHLAGRTDWDCAAVRKTLAWGREVQPIRFFARADSHAELLAALDAAADGQVGRWPATEDVPATDGVPAETPPPSRFRPQLCRLPGPALDGRSYWPDENRWI